VQTLEMHGGTFTWQPDDTGEDAYIGNLRIYGGTFDASQTTNADRSKVLGNGTGTSIRLFRGGTMKLDNARGNISVHTAADGFYNFGGVLNVDSNVKIGLTNNAT